MTQASTDLFVLYQMGASEDWTWFSVVGVFFSEEALRAYAGEKGIVLEQVVMEPTSRNEVLLSEPKEFVVVRSHEGAAPDVELAQ
jgi:hypothetical protein